MDVLRETTEGFARGSFAVDGLEAHRGKQLQIEFQNENLIASIDGSIIACVPDLICCLESEGVHTAFPILSTIIYPACSYL